MDINSCCRACLGVFSTDKCKRDVLYKRSKIKAQFNECCGNGEQNIIEPPRYLCTDCSKKTREFYEFKQMCFNSMIKWITLRPVGCTYASVDSSCSSDECDNTSPSIIGSIPVTSTTEENDCCEICSAGHEDRYHVEMDSNEEANDTEQNEDGNDTTIIDQIEDANDMAAEQNEEENDTTVIQHNEESNYTGIEQFDEIIVTDVEDTETESDDKQEIGKRAQNPTKTRTYMLLSSYTGHMLEHQGVRNGLLCPEIGCNLTFGNKRDLSQHKLKNHTPKQSQVRDLFPCPICSKVFISRGQRHMHIVQKHEKGVLRECKYCRKRFCNLEKLYEHERGHEGDIKYDCPEYPRSFTQPADRILHMQIKHDINPLNRIQRKIN